VLIGGTHTYMTYEIISTLKRKTTKIKTSIDVYNAIKKYGNYKQELFIVLTLNNLHDIIAIHICTMGLVNRTVIHPREVFKHAFIDNAVCIAIVHNHPSGLLLPSFEDIEITDLISEAGKIMEIKVIDHLIITQKGYYSFRDNNNIKSSGGY